MRALVTGGAGFIGSNLVDGFSSGTELFDARINVGGTASVALT